MKAFFFHKKTHESFTQDVAAFQRKPNCKNLHRLCFVPAEMCLKLKSWFGFGIWKQSFGVFLQVWLGHPKRQLPNLDKSSNVYKSFNICGLSLPRGNHRGKILKMSLPNQSASVWENSNKWSQNAKHWCAKPIASHTCVCISVEQWTESVEQRLVSVRQWTV